MARGFIPWADQLVGSEMEAMEGLMGKLKLSEAERKGIRDESKLPGKGTLKDPQALGKILSEKPILVWCPLRGIGKGESN